MASAEEQNLVRKVQFQLNEALECQEENKEVPRVKILNDQKNLNSFNKSKKEKLIEEQLNKELPKQSEFEQKKEKSLTFTCAKVGKCLVKDNIESPEESADNPSLQTSDESSSIPMLEAKAEGAPMFHPASFGQKSVTKYVDNKLGAVVLEGDDIKHSDNFPRGGKENSVDECLYGEELSSNDVHEVPMWTIPEFIIALCGDNQLPIQKRPQTEFETVDSDVEWLVRKNLQMLNPGTMAVLFHRVNIPVPICKTLTTSAYPELRDIGSVLPLEQVFTDSPPPVGIVEKVTRDSVDAEVEKNNVEDKKLLGKSTNTAKTQVVITTQGHGDAENLPHVYAKVIILNEKKLKMTTFINPEDMLKYLTIMFRSLPVLRLKARAARGLGRNKRKQRWRPARSETKVKKQII
ncbi:Hypothetical predicted protein [Paramuricea clavata]|uniref:Uncharacterized protein n=1 Tax=Paramuricea clavata TaxID=317549 RepID=A0A7D9HPV7_PARCT|nr:Hypothetical predicted protein [Paramuricea clavata]